MLCDVSGSVANFASFTLLLVYALREQFTKVRAFTFVDDLHEVTAEFTPGADPEQVLTRLADSARHASMWGRTDYGRAFGLFQERHADALNPKTSLLVLGDGRSNYTDPGLHHLREMAGAARHAWWLNPEHTRQWGTGDSAAPEYAEVVADGGVPQPRAAHRVRPRHRVSEPARPRPGPGRATSADPGGTALGRGLDKRDRRRMCQAATACRRSLSAAAFLPVSSIWGSPHQQV